MDVQVGQVWSIFAHGRYESILILEKIGEDQVRGLIVDVYKYAGTDNLLTKVTLEVIMWIPITTSVGELIKLWGMVEEPTLSRIVSYYDADDGQPNSYVNCRELEYYARMKIKTPFAHVLELPRQYHGVMREYYAGHYPGKKKS